MSFVRTHVFVVFADPYLCCEQCGQWVSQWHDPERCGYCDEPPWNVPCEHRAGITSACPSWSPVDGCCCQEFLGQVGHSRPPADIALVQLATMLDMGVTPLDGAQLHTGRLGRVL